MSGRKTESSLIKNEVAHPQATFLCDFGACVFSPVLYSGVKPSCLQERNLLEKKDALSFPAMYAGYLFPVVSVLTMLFFRMLHPLLLDLWFVLTRRTVVQLNGNQLGLHN